MPAQACAAQQTPLACVAVGLRLLAALLLWASGLLGAAPAVAQVRSVLPAEASLARGGAEPITLQLAPEGVDASLGRLSAFLCPANLPPTRGLALSGNPCRGSRVGPIRLAARGAGVIVALPTAEQLRAAQAAPPAATYLVLVYTLDGGDAAIFAVRLLEAAGTPTAAASAGSSASLGTASGAATGSAGESTGTDAKASEPAAPRPTIGSPPSFTPPAVGGSAVQAEPVHEPGQLLVLWATQADADAGLALLASRYRQRPRLLLPLPSLGVVVAQLQLPDTRAALALRDTLRVEQPGWITDQNARSSLQGNAAAPSAAPTPRLYALRQLQLSDRPLAASPQLKLGVIDAALDPALPLHTSARSQRSVLGPADVPAPIDHGAVVAQLIAGPPLTNGFAGAAAALQPGVHLLWASAVRQVNGQPRSHSLHTLAALDWLLAQGAQLINLSLGGVGDAVLEAAFARLRERPVLLVAAAGNNGPDAPPVYPAAYPGVLAVTAVDFDSQPYALANRGPYVGLAAPGVDVWVPVPPAATPVPGAGQYVSGTSFATALVSATLARAGAAWWQQPKAAQLASLCRASQDLGATGRDPVFGCGLLDAARLGSAP
ncbi:MAG: S8 family serine peptidase [Vitreoscilla sp.]|nr:S8 family serine peptidase [Vitreoscilla sp.]